MRYMLAILAIIFMSACVKAGPFRQRNYIVQQQSACSNGQCSIAVQSAQPAFYAQQFYQPVAAYYQAPATYQRQAYIQQVTYWQPSSYGSCSNGSCGR